jgi:repressor LexA
MTAARQRKKGLTERQIKILQVLDRFQRKSGYPPTIREICEKTEISSTSVVNYYLDRLEEMGYIERDTHVSRGIRLVRQLEDMLVDAPVAPGQALRKAVEDVRQTVEEILRVPIVGRIFASSPVPMPSTDFSYMDAESMINVARSMLPEREKPENLFALEVRGESMIDAMVYDGDIVIMKRAQEARNGEMVAVWLLDQDETTLKYFYKENNRIRLQPANPTMDPIYKDPKVVQIQGKVVMVIRSVSNKLN